MSKLQEMINAELMNLAKFDLLLDIKIQENSFSNFFLLFGGSETTFCECLYNVHVEKHPLKGK